MKLFVTDLDGTLVEYNNITDENLKGIKKLNASGELLAVATGRAYNSCTFLKDKYGIKVDYLILLNGGLIIDKDGKVVHHKEIPYNTVNSIIAPAPGAAGVPIEAIRASNPITIMFPIVTSYPALDAINNICGNRIYFLCSLWKI